MMEARKKEYFETTGYSMWPFLRQQDRVIVEQTEYINLMPGNLIVYKSDGQPTCHRLVKKIIFTGKYHLFARGDYVPSWKTEKIEEDQVTGRVSGIVRGSKIISLEGMWPRISGRAIILIFPIVAWTVATLERIFRKR